MRVLVVGGAGYIGSHMTRLLADNGHEAVVLDNLSTGFRDAVTDAEFVHGDAGDGRLLDGLFSSRRFDAVMHFASFIQVGESRTDPAKYYDNNVVRTLVLLDAMVRHKLPCMIFSSSAAVFGEPEYVPIDERHPARPINPYGTSKWIVERVLADYDRAYGLRHACLRYFNAAGADPSGRLGERHEPETHLIPLVLRAAAGRLPAIRIFGTDYDTPDGTCIRDYVHIVDLCQAHLLALERLASGAPSAAYNLGNGNGFSVREIISAAARVTGATIPVETAPRRAGDPARLVADASAAHRELGWRPEYAALETIIAHAWNWERRAGATSANPRPRSAGVKS